ncbi:hypothetical protein HYV86_04320 [Candidatus Woesearchaeota archaeon]|nr:hypothetical protein [Candidatus Woesearchaeota archaeon]
MPIDYLVLRGPIGVGKTTTAYKLMEKLRLDNIIFSYFCLDLIGRDLIGGEPSSKRRQDTMNMIAPEINNQITQKRFPIIDGLFDTKLIELTDLVITGKPLYITLHAPLAICYVRNNKREGAKKREFEKVKKSYEMTLAPHSTEVVIENTNDITTTVEKIYQLIQNERITS